MKNIFDSIKVKRPNQSMFDLSHEKKMSMKMGELVPVFIQEVLPGDKFTVNSEVFMRMAPLIAPVMHRVNCYVHFFKVPNRLIWNEWESFITGGEDGLSNPTFPKISLFFGNKDLTAPGTLGDYMGLPNLEAMDVDHVTEISALPFRAYQLIYNEYYRDQNLTTAIEMSLGGTMDAAEQVRLLTMRKRAWEKDYFTSALPWAQRGASVGAPVDFTYDNYVKESTGGGTPPDGTLINIGDTLYSDGVGDPVPVTIQNLVDDVQIDINALRTAVKLQEWLERNARGGSRYIEQIFSHFGVKSSDSRLQRPEYLGGGKQPVVISEVLNTTGTEELPQGNMAGHGVSVGNSNRIHTYCEEHGYIIGIMSVLPRTAYQNGLPLEYRKFDKLDYYFPEFANLGEQEIKNFELFLDGSDPIDETTWGYQQRYAEYKFKQSTVHGEFKDTLNFWHMGRIFTTPPDLNTSFVESSPTTRIFAVEETEQLYVQIYNQVKALRPIPYYSIPSLL